MNQSLTQTTSQQIVWLGPNQVEQNDNQQTQIEEEKEKVTQQQDQQLKKKQIKRSVTWTEDTIDNEFLNKKKSNVCCVYHKPWDAECISSDTCSSDDQGNELDRDRSTKQQHKLVCSKKKNQISKKQNQGDQDKCCHN